jgi:hypothetical protein
MGHDAAAAVTRLDHVGALALGYGPLNTHRNRPQRKPLLFVWLYWLRDHQHQLVIAYLCLAALSWKYWVKIHPIVRTVAIGIAGALAVFTISGYISAIVFYLLYPNYIDHGPPVVASMSWLWMHGHELYPNWATGDVYGSVYGPLTFLMNGIALQWSPSIFASKLPGVLSLGVASAIAFMLFTRKTASSVASLFLVASLALLCGLGNEVTYWNRPEPFLILVGVLSLFVALRSSPWVAVISVGVLAGLAVGFKLYGFIYTLPAAAVALARVETLRGRLVAGIIGSACAVSSAILPYLEKGASITSHLRFLGVVFGAGWSADLFTDNLLIAFVLAVPIVGIWIWWKPALNTPDRWLLAALALSLAMVTVIGAKKGGGAYYLLPLIPLCMYGITVVCPSSKIEAKGIAAFVFVSFLLAYGPHLILHLRDLGCGYQVAARSQREKIAELKAYLDTYPNAQIGISDDAHYSSYFYRVLSVFNGQPLHIDFTVWMDLAYGGVDERYIVRFLNGCSIPTWILPLGRPFTQVNWYNGLPLVSESFRQTFLMNYRKIENGEAYQVWQCTS